MIVEPNHPTHASRYTIVLINNANDGEREVDFVVEFLANEHFKVIKLDLKLDRIIYSPIAGDSFGSYPVYVSHTGNSSDPEPDIRRSICHLLGMQYNGFADKSMNPVVDWIDFDGNSVTAADLNRLLIKVTQSSLQPGVNARLRNIIVQHAPQLLQSTIDRYEADGFLDNYWLKWRDRLPLDQLQEFLSAVPVNALVLDAGCGPGHHSLFIASHGHQVVALDFTIASMRFAARHREQMISPMRADINYLPFKNDTFDGIWCCATLVHFPIEVVAQILAEFRRALRPNGILSFSVSVGKLPAVDPDGRFFDSFSGEAEIQSTCSAAGLEIVSTSLEISQRTTTGGPQLARWMTVVTRNVP